MNISAELSELREACHRFADAAAPFCHIADAEHYEMSLQLVEILLEEADDTPGDPLHAVISMLSDAIEQYESTDSEIVEFEKQAVESPPVSVKSISRPCRNDLASIRGCFSNPGRPFCIQFI